MLKKDRAVGQVHVPASNSSREDELIAKKYGVVLVSQLKSHFIVLILHFMLYFSNLMLHPLHFHALLQIDSENSFYEGTMVCQWCPIS